MLRPRPVAFILPACLAFLPTSLAGQVLLSPDNAVYTQDFNGLVSGPLSGMLPGDEAGAWFVQTGRDAATELESATPASNTSGVLNYGASGDASDRALGARNGDSSTGAVVIGLHLLNDSDEPIRSLAVEYTGKQFRDSSTDPQEITVHFSPRSFEQPGIPLGLATTEIGPVHPAGYKRVFDLTFTSPSNENARALNPPRTETLREKFSVYIKPGQEALLLWMDHNHSGIDHGLAIDDVTVTAGYEWEPLPDF